MQASADIFQGQPAPENETLGDLDAWLGQVARAITTGPHSNLRLGQLPPEAARCRPGAPALSPDAIDTSNVLGIVFDVSKRLVLPKPRPLGPLEPPSSIARRMSDRSPLSAW